MPTPDRGAAAFRALFCGYSARGLLEKVLAVFKAYIDDSASDQDMREIVLAGYVQTCAVWEVFSDAWQAVLDASPSIRYFHMVEAQNLRGEFKGWTEEARDAKVAAFVDVIDRHEPWSVSCHMSLAQFDGIVRPIAPYDLSYPYHYCMTAIVSTLARLHASEGWTGRIDFVFDDKSEVGPELAMFRRVIWETLDRAGRAVLGKLDHEDDTRVLPLQAADLFAWHVRRSGEIRYANERRLAYGGLLGTRHASVSLGSRFLREIALQMKAVPHVELTRGKKGSIFKKGSIRKAIRNNPARAMAAIDRAYSRRSAWSRLRALASRFLPWGRK